MDAKIITITSPTAQNGKSFVSRFMARRLADLGKKVVLIDDVITTRSTVTACAKTLRNVGVARIDVPSVARVVMHESVAV